MGNQINQSIVIDARVKATLEGMEDVVSKLNKGLREGTTKVDLTKGIGASLSKNIEKFKEEFSRFSKLTEGGKVEFGDSKEAIKSGENLIKTFRELKRIVGDFDDLSVLDAKRLFPDAFDSRVGELLKGLNGLSSAMSRLETKRIDLSKAETELESLETKAKDFKAALETETTAKINLETAKKELESFDAKIEAIKRKASEGISLKIETAKREQSEAETKKQQIEAARAARGISSADFVGSTKGNPVYQGKSIKGWTRQAEAKNGTAESKAEAQAAIQAIRLYHEEEEALKRLGDTIGKKAAEVKKLQEAMLGIDKMDPAEAAKLAGGSEADQQAAQATIAAQAEAKKAADAAAGAYQVAQSQARGAKEGYDRTTAAIEEQRKKVDKLKIEVGSLEKEVSPEALAKAFSTVGIEGFNVKMLESKEGIEQLRQKLEALDQEKLDQLKQQFVQMGLSSDQAEEYIKQLRGTIEGVGNTAQGIKKSASEMDNLKNSVLQFFSLTNAVQLFKRAVTSALNTVKELDATMTEAAVVTDFSVGDMWSRLPEYSAEAQKLGVSINGMYQATTLYYQQGLKTNEAMELGVETMKMAKIAGMESADATTAMTAALRGFNMELNEVSAVRVNDVYSQLAAITAADTNQIATAMEKTASIAASAHMEFESTAAFLAQIIETTQEAPETAGTALKTIIARFSEVKELKKQGQFTGKDEEGEDIDVNKIQTALRTVGISMDGFFAGTEGLDSVLMKLAEKWDTLDFETQRYVATMAAGSRQQSRFIAMMSDYGRTQELVSAANGSAGASQEQFNKTLESMETKLQKLENAWNEFLMGLANNKVLKGAIDLLTSVIEAINKMVSGFEGGWGDAIKTISSLMLAIGGIKLGKKVLGGGLDWVGNQLGLPSLQQTKEYGRQTGRNFQQGVTEGQRQQMSTTPSQTAPVSGNLFKNMGTGFRSLAGTFRGKTKADELAAIRENKSGLNSQWLRANDRLKEIGVLKGELQSKARSNRERLGQKRTKWGTFESILTKGGVSAEEQKRISGIYSAGGKKGNQKAIEELDRLGFSYLETGEQAKLAGYQMEEQSLKAEQAAIENGELDLKNQHVSTSFQSLAGAAQIAGGACMGLGMVLGIVAQKMEEAGDTEAAESYSKWATSLTLIGTLLSALPGIIAGVKAAWMALNVAVTTTSGIIGLIIVGIMAVLAIIQLIWSSMNKGNETLTQRLERVREATKEAQEAAEQAKEAYDELLSGHTKYDDLQKNLNRLTKGTQEWTTALLESNAQVMELIDTYPELANYLTMGEFGQLQVSEAGWDEAQAVAQSSANRTAAVWMASKAEEYNLEAQKAREERNAQLTEIGISHDVEELFQEYLRDPTQFKNEAFLEKWAVRTGGTKENVKKAAGIFAQQLVKEQNAKSTGAALIKTGMNNYISEDNKGTDYANDVVTHFSGLISSSVGQNRLTQEANELNSSSDKRSEVATELGITITGTDASKLEDLQKIYAKMMNIKVEDISEDLKKDAKGLASAIANGRLFDEYGARANRFIEKTRGADKNTLEQVAALLSGNPSSLTYNGATEAVKTDISELATKLGYSSATELATDLGYEDLSFTELSDEDKKKYVKKYHGEFLDNKDNWQKAYDAGSGEREVKGKTEVKNEKGELVTTKIDGVDYQVYQGDDGTRYVEYEDEQYRVDNQGQIAINWTNAEDAYGDDTVTADKQLVIDQEERKEQIEQKKAQIANVFDGIDLIAEEYVGDKSVEVASAVANQISTMGSEGARKYLDAWKGLSSAEVQDYMAQVDWSNMAEATEAMEFMQSKGMDPAEIEAFWKAATEGAGTYVKTLAEALRLTDSLQKKVQNVNNIEKAFTEGTATYEDMLEFSKAGVDVSKFQLTDTGWKATAEDIAVAKAQLLDYYATQARMQREATANKFAQDKQTAKGMGITQNEDGSWSIQAGRRASNNTEVDAKGNLVSKQLNLGDANYIANQLGLEGRGEEESEEDFIARTQLAYNEFLDNLNNGDEKGIIQDKTVVYTELAAAQASLDAGAKAVTDSWDRWQKLLKSGSEDDRTKALGEMQKAAKKLLDVEGDLSEEFLTSAENQELMKKAAQGDKKALQELRKAAATDVFKNLKGGGEELANGMQQAIDKVTSADIEVGVTVTLNEDDPNLGIAESLTDQYNAAYQAVLSETGSIVEAEKAGNKAIEANSYVAPEMVAQTIEAEGQMPPGYSFEANGDTYTDPMTGIVYSGIKTVPDKPGTYTYTTTRFVPKDQSGYTKKTDTVGGGGSDGDGKGGGGKKYKNSHDKQYNAYEKINALLRERERIERRYDKLLKNRSKTGKQLLENTEAQLASLKEEEKLQTYVRDQKAQEIQDFMAENSKYSNYVTGFDAKTGTIQIDWDEFNAIKDSEKGAEVDEYLSKLEKLRDQWVEAQNSLDGIEDNTENLKTLGKDEYFDLEDRIKEALVNERQEEIDKLSEINDSINDTNSKILDSMQEQIDEYRQNRDNKKTEEEIADKQRKLAYLQQDTSGANATEILNLQKEIDEAQEDYTDTLIDQKISELQKQNDQAAEQRQQQIDIMQAQLDRYVESGEIWRQVHSLMDSGIGSDGMLLSGSRLEEILKKSEEFQSLSPRGQQGWLDELLSTIKGAYVYSPVAHEGQSVTFTNGSGKTLTGVADKYGDITVSDETYKKVRQDKEGNWTTTETAGEKKPVETPKTGNGKISSLPSSSKLSVSQVKALQQGLNDLLAAGELSGFSKLDVDGSYGKLTKAAVKKLQAAIGATEDGIWGPKTKEKFGASALKAYKSGGLADFTGPAWLDGTKSKPEYILSADQTKAFFRLVDVLGSLQGGDSKTAQNSGDTSFDIDINVESIGSDYDVEQLANKVKSLINEDARYRNNNAINLMR